MLTALLVAATVLFAIGVAVERSAEPARQEPAEHAEPHADETEDVRGVNAEATPLVVLAVIAGLGLAVLASTRIGGSPRALLAIALITLAWAALDVREVVHQLDESRPGVALIAAAVAAAHLASAALAGRLAVRSRRHGTMAA